MGRSSSKYICGGGRGADEEKEANKWNRLWKQTEEDHESENEKRRRR